jgi:S-DNA-T family DNA segregation ATPase FtsK/SpoIIIE
MGLISNYITNKIVQESQISLKEGTSGKFILRNYPLSIFESLMSHFSSDQYDDILLLVDDQLSIETYGHNCIQASHEVMAQYRNENVQHSTIDLNKISYIVFITNETIDTLNDISTLTPDDISLEFENVIDLVESSLFDNKSKQKLKNICKVFFKEIDGLSPFEIESFVETTLNMMEDGYPIEDAMGLSLHTLNSFKCHKCFEPLKKSALIKDTQKIIQPIKNIISAFRAKSIGNKTVPINDLLEKYYKNIDTKEIDDDFSILGTTKQELIEKFINADARELSLHKQQFNQLDWYEDSIYRLFEKTKSDTSKPLGQETKELLEEKDVEITEIERDNLLQYDDLPARERESLRSILEPVYKKYKGYIEDSKSLRNKWDKFLYPSQSKSNDFILGVLETIKKLKSEVDNIDHINVSLKQSQTTAIMRNYSKHAINYLHKRYSVLNSISKTVNFDFQFIQDIEEKILNDKKHPTVKKYKSGSFSKSANELHFIIQAQNSTNEKLAERKLIWSFDSSSILSGYKEDIDSLLSHLKSKCIYSNVVYRVTGSEKGEKKPLSLFDFSSLESRGNNSGFRLFPTTCNSNISSKNIIKSAEELLENDTFVMFKDLFNQFLNEYTWILNQLGIQENIEKHNSFDFNRIEEFSLIYINLTKILFDNSENDKFKKNVIEPFLSLVTVRVGQEDTVIIPSYHPLRLISYFVKLKHTFDFLDSYVISNDIQMIKEDLYFSDLEQSFNTPYYPEVFRLFDVDGKEESLLHISEICDDYTILEPIKNYLESGQSTDPLAQTAILTKVIENYLSLNNHKQSSLKILLHAVNNYDFPVKFMKKLMSLDFTSQDNNFEIYLNDVDASHIRKMYRAFLVNQNSKDAEEALEYNEISFLSNIRLNAFDQSFKQLDNVNDQLNIAFLNDFVSSKAKLEFRKQVLDKSFSLFNYHPTMWSKRKYMTEKEMTVGKYLVSPAKSDLTSAFYDLLYLTMSTHKDDYKDKIPTLNIDRSHKNLYTDLEAIHKRTDWVVNLDSLLDKKILEEFGANVIKYRKARHINRNLVISSKANTILLESHLKNKFEDFNINKEIVDNAVENIIKSANDLSGDVLLKAIGRGSFANEMLGLVLTKTILENCSSDSNVMIYIDDYADWFLSSINSEEKLLTTQNNVLADILSITPIFENNSIKTIYIDIVEVKFCNEASRAKLAKKSLQQTKDSFAQIKKVFEDNNCFDKEYWLAKISDLIVETHHKSFTNDLTSEDIRNIIRLDKNIHFVVRGMSYVFVYDYEDDYQSPTDTDEFQQYTIGLNSIKSIIESLPNFNFTSCELTLPTYNTIATANSVIETTIIEVKNEVVSEEVLDHNSNTNDVVHVEEAKKIQKEVEKAEIEKTEGNMISHAVKKVVMYHKYRAKILKYLFTPNAVRISLEPELGWNENIFYKMSNDFLSVERLQLLRVEVVPGSYDLVFQRKQRQVISYQDCLDNRELSEGFGNTKILLGRNEANNEVVYYNLDSEDPHALIAGMTKSGKSVLLNIFIIDLIRTNKIDELELILVDPKQVEFTRYKNIPYLDDDGIITNKDLAIKKLHDVVEEMEKRYSLFQEANVNDLIKYNTKITNKLARIVLIFDEFADWMLDDEFKRSASDAIQRLAGKARAAGIHLIVSTQRPDNTVVPMILRANLGAKFALRVDTEKNSNIIIDESGAEKLLGYGHMITKFAGQKQYIQSAFISDEYIEEVLESL